MAETSRGFSLHGITLVLLCVGGISGQTTIGPYVGCFQDSAPRAMGTVYRARGSLTIESGASYCMTNTSATYVGLQAGFAYFCANSYDRHGRASSCVKPCNGNISQTCGGEGMNSVYGVCPERKWGTNCDQPCTCVHGEGKVCFRRNGTCSSGCLPGWTGSRCDADINECTERTHRCSAGDSLCTNTVGSYTCSCPDGHELTSNQHTCRDINECTERTHRCSAGASFCTNTAGSYTCSCPDGHDLLSNQHTCRGPYVGCFQDSAPRAMGTVYRARGSLTIESGASYCMTNTSATYVGLQAGFAYFCANSYDRHGRASSCVKPCNGNISQTCGGEGMNSVYGVCPERKWGTNCDQPCTCVHGEGKVCFRRNGTCSSGCLPGWTGSRCDADINECTERTHRCSAGVSFCTNTNGSYICSCQDGYVMTSNQHTCQDVNECTAGTGIHQCAQNCSNTPGTYTCSCYAGYRLQSDRRGCSDIDECIERTHQCSAGDSFCTNTAASYTCSCPDGYELTGDRHTCQDVNECTAGTHQCAKYCHNTPGTYTCSCDAGYRLQGDRRGCSDINECTERTHQCSAGDSFCTNTAGSYTCDCPGGYKLLSNGQTCQDIDECAGAHQCSAGKDYCKNTAGSYDCSCPTGYDLYDGERRRCTDTDECLESKLCAHDCKNTNGSYTCSCRDGYSLESNARSCAGRPSSVSAVVGGVIGVLLAVGLIVLIIFFLRRRRERHKGGGRAGKKANFDGPDVISDVGGNALEDGATSVDDIAEYVNEAVVVSPSVRLDVTSLAEHYSRLCKNNGAEFLEEFTQIPDKDRASFAAASDPAVKDKNKFKNILPYDHTRVTMKGPGSDYINASYMKVNDSDRCQYIAAQGPQKTSTIVFWKMVWQEKTSVIVMLTNPMEIGKIKCAEYWPTSGSETHGEIQVTLLSEERMPDFAKRTFVLGHAGEEREVRQYHFTTWPDHGVPHSPSSLLKMLHKVRAEPKSDKRTIVHCSAGVGRTGTFISIDKLLKQADREGVVDVVACIDNLRNSRMKMVQTVAQFRYVYAAILENLSTGPTSFPCPDFMQGDKCKAQILQSAKKHYQVLDSTTMKPAEKATSEGLLTKNRKKNRNQKIPPLNSCRVLLNIEGDNYINAVFVNGFSRKNEFIATQVPLTNTVGDFWQMIYDYKCPFIVVMEQEQTLAKLPTFLPQEVNKLVTMGNFQLCLSNKKGAGSHHMLQISFSELRDAAEEEEEEQEEQEPEEAVYENRMTAAMAKPKVKPKPTVAKADSLKHSVKVFVLTEEVAENTLVECYSLVQKWQRKGVHGPVVTVCTDGVTKCGLYVGSSVMLDMVAHEQEVDVFYTLRCIRKFRPEFIVSEEQYQFLLRTAAEHLKSFETYSNFN